MQLALPQSDDTFDGALAGAQILVTWRKRVCCVKRSFPRSILGPDIEHASSWPDD